MSRKQSQPEAVLGPCYPFPRPTTPFYKLPTYPALPQIRSAVCTGIQLSGTCHPLVGSRSRITWQGHQASRTSTLRLCSEASSPLPSEGWCLGSSLGLIPWRRELSWVCDCILTASCSPQWSSCSQRKRGGETQQELLSPDWPCCRSKEFLCAYPKPLLPSDLPTQPSRHMGSE